jgi:alpha-glucosidase
VIRLEKSGEAFSLYYKDRRLLCHSSGRPALTLGQGEGRYHMSHGHFRIRRRVARRQPCRGFRVLAQEPDTVVLEFPGLISLSFEVREERLELTFRPAQEGPGWNRFWLRLAAEPGESIYGCGEQFSVLNLRGRRVPLWVQEQGVGRGKDLITLFANISSGSGGSWHSTYFPQAGFVSSHNWSCDCRLAAYAEFDFRAGRSHLLEFWQVPERVVFHVEESPTALIERRSAWLGVQSAQPGWADRGIWLGLQGGSQVVRAKLEQARRAGIRPAAVWVQDWEGRRLTAFGSQLMWDWRYDSKLYPDLPELIAELKEQGIRFLGYINPGLAPEGELYQEASRLGHCVKNPQGEDYLVPITTFRAALVDLSSEAARTWYKTVIKENMLALGMAGWMADYGEYLPVDARLASGLSGEQAHNLYPLWWARVNREAVSEAGQEDEIFYFLRAGWDRAHVHAPGHWAGDQLAGWSRHDGLASVIPAGISLGLGGVGSFHSDVGGFTAMFWVRRSKELLLRWAELASFMPIMRFHEGNRPWANWQFDSDQDTLRRLARLAELFARLKPYRDRLFAEYRRSGLPLIRHPAIHYSGDEVLHRLKYQYLYGADLLVAPVISPRRRNHRVYLPGRASAERWVHLWSGRELRPGWRRVEAPLGRPPVFFRAGSSEADFFRDLAAI